MKLCTLILLLAALPVLANAESYVCVEDQATGFSFNTTQKVWEKSGFHTDRKYLVKPNSDTSLQLQGKWIVSQIGHRAPIAWSESDFTSAGELRFKGPFGEFAMNKKNLRFVTTYIIGYWTNWFPDEGEFTPFISIGTCSVLEP